MTRTLNTATLDNAARYLAGQWFAPSAWSRATPEGGPKPRRATAGRDYVLQSFYHADFKDEFEYLHKRFLGQLGPDAVKEFKAASGDLFTPRDPAVFERKLMEKLAINPAGEKIKGAVGTTSIGEIIVGQHMIEVETPASLRRRKLLGLGKDERETHTVVRPKRVPIFVGQERALTDTARFLADQGGALSTNIAVSVAIGMLDFLVDDLDSGSVAGMIEGRDGAQPADPDAATTGNLLFTLRLTDPSFPNSVDNAAGAATATASAIADDVSADATFTLGYCRASSSNVLDTALDSKIDGEAATSGGDFNFNTLAIVSGATVSMTSWVITMSQGPDAV